MTWQTMLRICIAAFVVAFAVIYVRDVDWSQIADVARSASPWLLVVGVLGNVPLIALKAMRLRLLVGGRVGVVQLMGFYVTSYAADNLLMSQAGLGVRVALLRGEGIPLATAAAVQGVEKLVEGVGLALIALPLVAMPDLAPWLRTTLHWCLGIGGGAALALVVLVVLSHREIHALRQLKDTLALLRHGGLALRVAAATLAAWIIEVLIVAATLAALHLPVDLVTATIVLVAVNVASLVPGLPANLGSFEMAAVLALDVVGVPRAAALGFAILYHASHTIPVTLIGLAVGAKGPAGKGRTG